MNESPAALCRAEPEVPVLPVGEDDVVAIAIAPDGAAHHGAGVDVIAPEQPRQVELRHGDVAGSHTELAAIAVDYAAGWIRIEQSYRFIREAGQQTVVGVEREEGVAAGCSDPAGAGRGEAGRRLVHPAR